MSRTTLVHQGKRSSTFVLLPGIWRHLGLRRRMQLGLLLLVMLGSGLAELLSLGAVLPFLSLISDPEELWRQPLVQEFALRLGFTSAPQLLLPASLLFAFASLFAASVRLTNLWLNGRLAAAAGSDLSSEAYRRTLYQSYEVHLLRNTAALITGTTKHISVTVVALNRFLQLITSTIVAAALFLGLLIVDAPVATGAAILFGCSYIILSLTSRTELRRNSKKIVEASTQQVKALQEGIELFVMFCSMAVNLLIFVFTVKLIDRSDYFK